MRSRALVLTAIAVAMTALLSPMQEQVSAQSGTGIVISEYRFRGPLGANDEFIELFNGGTADVNVGGWLLRVSNNNLPPVVATRMTIAANTVIKAGCFFLAVNTSGYSGSVAGDQGYPTGFADDGGLAVINAATGTIIDQVGQGTVAAAFGEGTRLPMLTTDIERGIERRPGGSLGHVDTNNNASDFREITPSHPQNSASTCLTRGNIAVTASASSASVEQGGTLTVFGRVFPGTVPPSSGLQVIGDLSNVGGSATTMFSDTGVAPDAVANDNIFSAAVNVPANNALGPRTLSLTASDAQHRSATDTITVSVIPPAVIYLPHDVQGAGALSPLAPGTIVTVRGVVTARKADGLFIQTEPGMEDANADTSEGLFVFTGAIAPSVPVGRVVNVTASVAEFVPISDPSSPSLTELMNVIAITDVSTGTLPAPYVLTSDDVSDLGALDQLERFEGMRVSVASLTAISATGGTRNEVTSASTSDGAFFAVLTGQARPFREAGIESGYPAIACGLPPCNIPVFDGNPERLRIDSDAIEGMPAVEVSSGAVMTNVTGPLDFAARTYTLLPEAPLNPAGGTAVLAAPAPAGDQFTIGSISLDRFYDATNDPGTDPVLTASAYQLRVAKASSMIRTIMSTPDVVGVQDVENLGALFAIANQIDADAQASSQPKPQYAAFLFDGNSPDGLNVGFLVKQTGSRVILQSIEQVGKGATFFDPADGLEKLLNDRPPVVLRALLVGPSTSLPQAATVIVNQFASIDGAGVNDITGQSVRARRREQAEFLASYIQGRQINDPNEAIVSIGDYNAPGFNDGYGDLVGAVRGVPVSPDQVAAASSDLVSPDLVDADEMTPASQRYSSLSRGNAELLDHVLVSANLAPQIAGVVHARINADFPDMLRGTASTPARLSDRDPSVAYFRFPRDVEAPTFNLAQQDHTVEATGPGGASVSYDAPVASDNLDPFVEVFCSPASGSAFPVGNNAVTCTAQDVAGNVGSVSFTVTVQDTVAPSITVPSTITVEAASSSGRVVAYTATAGDLVTLSPAVTCSPSSGSAFPVGWTTVLCWAADDAGNSSTAAFRVKVQDTTPPVLTVPANITTQAASASGRVVSFSTSATDAVTTSPAVTCSRASGSTFPIGTTTVACSTRDAAGNAANASFTVEVTPPVPGHMTGGGEIESAGQRVSFVFDVRESANYTERGTVMVLVRDDAGRPDRYLSANVSDVHFSRTAGYVGGTPPPSAVDTVTFAGAGTWNGQGGFRFEFTASDRGEPGVDRDTFSWKLYAPDGSLVLTAAGTLRGGNIQSVR